MKIVRTALLLGHFENLIAMAFERKMQFVLIHRSRLVRDQAHKVRAKNRTSIHINLARLRTEVENNEQPLRAISRVTNNSVRVSIGGRGNAPAHAVLKERSMRGLQFQQRWNSVSRMCHATVSVAIAEHVS